MTKRTADNSFALSIFKTLLIESDDLPLCVGGRGAAPPEFCGGPTGYRLMMKRQREGIAMSDPVRLDAGIQMMAAARADRPAGTWDLLRTVLAGLMELYGGVFAVRGRGQVALRESRVLLPCAAFCVCRRGRRL